MKNRFIAAVAAATVLITVSGAAIAAPYNLIGSYQRSSGGTLSSLAFKAGATQGCPGPTYVQPCIAPAQAPLVSPQFTTISGFEVAMANAGGGGVSPFAFDWVSGGGGMGTLTETGLFWSTSFISSNSFGAAVISDKVTNLVITITAPGVGTTNATAYDCLEGGFLASVGANGCKDTNFGANVADNSTTVWNAGSVKCVTETIGGDDYSLLDGGFTGTFTYNTQTANFTVGRSIKGATSGAIGKIVTDVDGGATGTLTVVSISPGNFIPGEIINQTTLTGSATVTAAPVLTFIQGTPDPRGVTVQAANQAGAGCAVTSAAFDMYNVMLDDGTYLILADTSTLGSCYLYGVLAAGGCPSNANGAGYMLFAKASAVDTDGDGNLDGFDNCPANANAGQQDADGDGVGDVCDPDIDGDGVLNGVDNCPVTFNPTQTNSDTDSRGDVCDNCKLVNNTDAGVVPNSPGVLKSQLDADQDGYGNVCDADLNNSGNTTSSDYTILRNALLQIYSASANAAKSDMNGSGTVTSSDYTLLRNRLLTPPGPSGLACAGTIPCTPP